MITEIVRFTLPADIPRARVMELFESTVPRWQSNPALLQKQYLFDPETGTGGGVYLWKNKASALAAHDEAWCALAESIYGSRPTFSYFETPLLIDNQAGRVLRDV